MSKIRMGLSLLETLTSALYEDPIILFREYVQNSVDSFTENKVEDFKININIDKENKNITIIDNGEGILFDKFERKMLSIGESDKNSKSDQIGFRGIGRLSAMPFCEKLIFINKNKDSEKIQKFEWNGKKYLEMLLVDSTADLETAMNDLSSYSNEKYDGENNDHFFKVELIGYSTEVEEMIEDTNFENKLSLLLPLKYSQEFSKYAQEISKEYKAVMGDSIERKQFDIYLNAKLLVKPFSEQHILESNIVILPIILKSTKNSMPDNKIGLIWFTFNRKVTSNAKNEPRGIWVRSKNMLVGDEYSIANVASKSKTEYITTYREMTQTLNGVYGEMLLNTTLLSDNTRRDWFRIDENSIALRTIIVEFIGNLYNYRRKASSFFNNKTENSKKEDLIKAYQKLTSEINIDRIKDTINLIDIVEKETIKESLKLEYADDDIPNESISVRRFYEKILLNLKNYYMQEKKEEIETFMKIRVHLKKMLNNEKE